MLSLALAATIVGFVLLILGLITGTVWLAISCIVVCLIGLGFLIADIIGAGRRSAGSVPNSVAGDDRADDNRADDNRVDADRADGHRRHAVEHSSESDTSSRTVPIGPGDPGAGGDTSASATQRFEQAPTAPRQSAPQSPTRVEGDYGDYLRSVGGLPPTQSQGVPPQGPTTRQGPTTPQGLVTPQNPATSQGPSQYQGPPSHPPRASQGPRSEYPGPPPQAPRPSEVPSEQQAPPSGRRRKIDPLDPEWRPPTR